MARPKGSKNKTRIVKANVDYAAVVAEKTAEKEKIESEVATLTANLDDLKTQMKAKVNDGYRFHRRSCTPFTQAYLRVSPCLL